ncbi:MAG: hypothetical protein ACRCUM_01380 [Mycoplasmoidaceae bacterium]
MKLSPSQTSTIESIDEIVKVFSEKGSFEIYGKAINFLGLLRQYEEEKKETNDVAPIGLLIFVLDQWDLIPFSIHDLDYSDGDTNLIKLVELCNEIEKPIKIEISKWKRFKRKIWKIKK